jgi:hypothetical protein
MRGILLYVNIKILVTDLRMLSNWVWPCSSQWHTKVSHLRVKLALW